MIHPPKVHIASFAGSFVSALTAGGVAVGAVSAALKGLARSATMAARQLRRSGHQGVQRAPDSDLNPPELPSFKFSDGTTGTLRCLSASRIQHVTDQAARQELKLLRSTIEYVVAEVRASDQTAEEDGTSERMLMVKLQTPIRDFLSLAADRDWGQRVPGNTIDLLKKLSDSIDRELNT